MESIQIRTFENQKRQRLSKALCCGYFIHSVFLYLATDVQILTPTIVQHIPAKNLRSKSLNSQCFVSKLVTSFSCTVTYLSAWLESRIQVASINAQHAMTNRGEREDQLKMKITIKDPCLIISGLAHGRLKRKAKVFSFSSLILEIFTFE